LPFVALLVVLLGGALVTLLLLNTLSDAAAFQIAKLQAKAATLATQEQALLLQTQQSSAPDALAAAATRLGMVPGTLTGVYRLRNGQVLEVLTGTAPPAPAPSPTPKRTAKTKHRSATSHRHAAVARPTATPSPKVTPKPRPTRSPVAKR
jgi:hypothetical protein